MNKEVILIVICLIIIVYYLYIKQEFTIHRSKIHGKGLFASKSYQKGDVIIANLFPYKDTKRKIKYVGDAPDFNDIIIHEGKYINHCSKKFNSIVDTNDYRLFSLIATKNIQPKEEITANYDIINQRIPFIADSSVTTKNHFRC